MKHKLDDVNVNVNVDIHAAQAAEAVGILVDSITAGVVIVISVSTVAHIIKKFVK